MCSFGMKHYKFLNSSLEESFQLKQSRIVYSSIIHNADVQLSCVSVFAEMEITRFDISSKLCVSSCWWQTWYGNSEQPPFRQKFKLHCSHPQFAEKQELLFKSKYVFIYLYVQLDAKVGGFFISWINWMWSITDCLWTVYLLWPT